MSDGQQWGSRRREETEGLWRQARRLTLESRQRPGESLRVVTRWMAGSEGAFRVRVRGPAEPAAGAVVLIHRVIVSGRYLTPLGLALSRDFAVAIPDLPGYGAEPSSDARPIARRARRCRGGERRRLGC